MGIIIPKTDCKTAEYRARFVVNLWLSKGKKCQHKSLYLQLQLRFSSHLKSRRWKNSHLSDSVIVVLVCLFVLLFDYFVK